MLLLFGDGLYGAVRQMAPAFADRALGVGRLSTCSPAPGRGDGRGLWLAHGGVARASPATILWGFLGFIAVRVSLVLSPAWRGGARHGGARGMLREYAEPDANGAVAAFLPDAMRGPNHEHPVSPAPASPARWRRRGRPAAANWGLRASHSVRRGAGAHRLGGRLFACAAGRRPYSDRPGGAVVEVGASSREKLASDSRAV